MNASKLNLCVTSLFIVVPAFSATYYIDCTSGSDSNSGTSKTAPWKHAPGMNGSAAGVGPGAIDSGNGCGGAICSLPGTNFIFKGGVACTSGNFPWTIREQGTGFGANVVYFGVDQTWYTGSSWARPIINLAGYNTSNGAAIQMAPDAYLVIDNLEFTGLNFTTSSGQTYINAGSAVHSEFKNLYMHGWSHAAYQAGVLGDGCHLIDGNTQGLDGDTSIHDNVFDGSDGTGDSCAAIWGFGAKVYNNFMQDLPNGAITSVAGSTGAIYFYQNTMLNINPSFDPTQHMNCYESNDDFGMYIYNNYVAHARGGYCIAWNTRAGYATYVFNNITVDVDPNENMVMASSGGLNTASSLYMWNNTLENGHDGSTPNGAIGCIPGAVICQFYNNFFITSASSPIVMGGTGGAPGSNVVQLNNITMSQAAANTAGYMISSTYPFTPPTSGASVAGAAKNLTSGPQSCSTSGLSALCSDSSVGVGYNTITHTVIVPQRTPLPRSSSAAWDVGAYNASGSGSGSTGSLVPPTTPIAIGQ